LLETDNPKTVMWGKAGRIECEEPDINAFGFNKVALAVKDSSLPR
jgi:hypothetical protein